MFEGKKKDLGLDTINKLIPKQMVGGKIKVFKKVIGYEIYETFGMDLKEWKEEFINQLEKINKKFVVVKLTGLAVLDEIQLDERYQKLSQEIKTAFVLNDYRLLETTNKFSNKPLHSLGNHLFGVLIDTSVLSGNVARIIRYLNNDSIKVIEIDAVLLEWLMADKQKLELLFSFIGKYGQDKIVIIDSLFRDKETIATLLKHKSFFKLKKVYFKNV